VQFWRFYRSELTFMFNSRMSPSSKTSQLETKKLVPSVDVVAVLANCKRRYKTNFTLRIPSFSNWARPLL
jgi:hypothetical protein